MAATLGLARYFIPVQVAWSILSAIWNIGGVLLVEQGMRAPGPTASIPAGIILLVFAITIPIAIHRWKLIYLLVSILTGFAASAAVVNAFTDDPAKWPSEFWRYAGVVLNGIGFLAALVGIGSLVRHLWMRRVQK